MTTLFLFLTNTRPANDTERPRSLKDLLCDACGKVEAVAYGMCADCMEDANAQIDERRWHHDEALFDFSGAPTDDDPGAA